MAIRLSPLPRGTRLGRRAGWIGIGLLFAGFNTGNNLFYLVFTVLASCEVVGFLASRWTLRALEAELRVPRRARVGGPLRVTLRLANRSRRLPVPALRWTVAGPEGEQAELRTPPLPPGGSGSATGRLAPVRRGRFRLGLIRALTDYPFGLAGRVLEIAPPDREVLVAPLPLITPPSRAGRRRGDRPERFRWGLHGEEPLEAREYRPGDDARGIDWKASARTGRWIWRERRGESPVAVHVHLDRRGPPGAAFERRVRVAAGMALAELERGRPVGFSSDELTLLPRAGASHRRRILDYLAVVEPAGAVAEP